ncbi:MAG: LCP family protein, partial [Chloroflexi bacterium]|nr:LCP family protein [Chloroflexota bacterium]
MTKTQKIILLAMGIVAALFFGAAAGYAWTNYRAFAARPLGPPLPAATKALPPVWTKTPADPSLGKATLVPTLAFPTHTAPPPLCGGPAVMNILAIGQDQRSNNYQYGLSDVVRLVRADFVTPKVTVLEFPRDLWVEIPYIADNLNGLNHGKLNQAYLYGQPGDGFAYWDDPSQGPGLLA